MELISPGIALDAARLRSAASQYNVLSTFSDAVVLLAYTQVAMLATRYPKYPSARPSFFAASKSPLWNFAQAESIARDND